jgi:hypothetical protein
MHHRYLNAVTTSEWGREIFVATRTRLGFGALPSNATPRSSRSRCPLAAILWTVARIKTLGESIVLATA